MTKRKPRCKLHTFTAEEDMVLHQLYPRATRNRIRNALWYIAWSTIERRAKVLGIVRTFVRVKNHGKPTYRPRDPKERQQQRERVSGRLLPGWKGRGRLVIGTPRRVRTSRRFGP